MTTTTRACDAKNYLCGQNGHYTAGQRVVESNWFFRGSGVERLISEGHPGYRNPSKGHGIPSDVGGPFSVQRKTFRSLPAIVDAKYTYGAGLGWYYSGEIHASVLGKSYAANLLPAVPSSATMNFIGTAGIRNNPVKPHGNLGQFLAELHDLPKLAHLENIRTTTAFFRSLGKNYLNVEFGWKPFIQDVRDFFRNTVDADPILRQLARDNGQLVRRKVNLGTENTTSVTSASGYFTSPSLVSYLYASSQRQWTTVSYERRRWFSGAFRYFIPQMVKNPFWSIESNQQRNRLSRVVYGASMTPDLLWELIPWSWCADWFGNVGDIVANYTDINLNNLVIEYAYGMQTERTVTEIAVTGALVGSGQFSCRSLDIVETKCRARSTPFGFGFDMSSLNSSQTAILAALGLSRLR